jgi:cell division protease FtsH
LTFGKRNEHVFLGRDFGHERNFSEEVASKIDHEIKAIVEDRYQVATKLLTENRDIVEEIAKILLEKETLDKDEIDEIIERIRGQRV